MPRRRREVNRRAMISGRSVIAHGSGENPSGPKILRQGVISWPPNRGSRFKATKSDAAGPFEIEMRGPFVHGSTPRGLVDRDDRARDICGGCLDHRGDPLHRFTRSGIHEPADPTVSGKVPQPPVCIGPSNGHGQRQSDPVRREEREQLLSDVFSRSDG